MDPEDIKKGRFLTWAVILLEASVAFLVMMWLVSRETGTLNSEELKLMPEADRKVIQSSFRENYNAVSRARLAGPIYFVVVLGLCLAVLGGNWWMRIGFGVCLLLGAAGTLATPWIFHPAVLKPNAAAILFAVLICLIHAAGGAVLLFIPAVKYFLHPRRMMYAAIPQQNR